MINWTRTQEITNYWSHAPKGMLFGDVIRQRPEEQAAWCAEVAGPLVGEAVEVVLVVQADLQPEATHAA